MNKATDIKKLRIIFMGTPEFAVGSLRKLLEASYNVVAVVTAPDKPAGRGLALQESAVKVFAKSKGLLVLQPEKLKDPSFIQQLKELHPDIQVVVAFRMLPEVVWNMPPMGTVNVHASLLPQYRGAAPINWAIINGDKITGVTTFKLKHEIDTGDILLSSKVTIEEADNAGTLHDKLKEEGATLLAETLKQLAAGTLKEQPQSSSESNSLKHAPKIFTDTCKINWDHSADEIYNLIRGLSPYPAAFTTLDNKKLKIFSVKKITSDSHAEPGSIETDNKSYLRFAAKDGSIDILDLQLEGKKRMNIADFLRGYRFEK